MFCKKCGANIGDEAEFCPKCGTKQGDSAPAQTAKLDRWESKVLQISQSQEQKTIKKYERFGWELASSQTVDTKDSHLEDRWDGLYSVTESTNYVKLTLRRNKNMPHYDELVKLEKQLDDLKKRRNSNADLDYEVPEGFDYGNAPGGIGTGIGYGCGVLFLLYFSFGLLFVVFSGGATRAYGCSVWELIILCLIGAACLFGAVKLFLNLVKLPKKVREYKRKKAMWDEAYKAAEKTAKEKYAESKKAIYEKAEKLLRGE